MDAEIIILSDGEDEEASEIDTPCAESSLCIVEPGNMGEPDLVYSNCALEEDLVVTFSRPADVLPHARYDCPIHPFTAHPCAIEAPLAVNQLFCDQCFCYICDQLASSCTLWCVRGSCHCNSHKKSEFWSMVWSCRLLGGLHSFNLTLSEVDAHLRHAEKMLQIFKKDVSVAFSAFLKGKVLMESGANAQNQQQVIHDYTPVYGLVSSFLNEADKQDDRAAAILRLGAAQEFMPHVSVPRSSCVSRSPMADATEAKRLLLQRVTSSLQRQLVMADFNPEFRIKLKEFYKRFLFPAELKSFRNSLCVRPWEDILLVTVLKGQNISGVRKEGKKKDVLTETISVILLRCEQLQRQKRYRELCRYLRVVQSAESALLQHLRDLVPFFTCLEGDLTSAVDGLLRPGNAPASRFTPQLFLNYLRTFQSAAAPKVTIGHPSHLWHSDEAWEPIGGAVPLKRETLVKFALRVQGCCPAVDASSQCWTSFLSVVNKSSDSGAALPPPHPNFLQEAGTVVGSVLRDQNIKIPRFFLEEYPDQALLLLVTGALGLRILRSPLKPALPVLSTFKDNLWALEWLPGSLPFDPENLGSFIHDIREEIRGTKGDGHFLQFLSSCLNAWTKLQDQ